MRRYNQILITVLILLLLPAVAFSWKVEGPGSGAGSSAGTPYNSNPAMNGSASAGTSDDYARGDHVHPSDTSKQDALPGVTPGDDGGLDVDGPVAADSFISTAEDGERFIEPADNTTMETESGKSRIGTEGGEWVISEGTTKETISRPSRAETFTNKTFDVDGEGNVLKSWGYVVLTHPHTCSAGAPLQTTSTSNTYGQCKYGNGTDKATNYAEYYLVVPANIDTSVDLAATFKFKLDNADTGDHEYEISMSSVADSAAYAGSLGHAVSLAYTADGSGAQYDVETAGETTLTDWKSNVTAGQLWVIRVARDGDHANDTSTVDSYSGPLVIKYKITQ